MLQVRSLRTTHSTSISLIWMRQSRMADLTSRHSPWSEGPFQGSVAHFVKQTPTELSANPGSFSTRGTLSVAKEVLRRLLPVKGVLWQGRLRPLSTMLIYVSVLMPQESANCRVALGFLLFVPYAAPVHLGEHNVTPKGVSYSIECQAAQKHVRDW